MWLPQFFSSSKSSKSPAVPASVPPLTSGPKGYPASKPPMTSMPPAAAESRRLFTPREPIVLPSRTDYYGPTIDGYYGPSTLRYQPSNSVHYVGGGGEYASEPMFGVPVDNPDPARFHWDSKLRCFVPYWDIAGGGGMPTHALVEVPSCELTDGSLRTHSAYAVGRNHAGKITLAVTEAPDLARFQVKHSLPVGEQLGKIGTETLNAVYLHATRRCCPPATLEIDDDEADVRRFQREHGLVADGKPSVATLDTIMRHPHGDCEKCKPKFTSSTGDLREQRKRIWEEAREALEYNDKIGYDALIKILEDLDNQIIASFAVPDMSIDKFGRSVCPCGYAEECSTWCGDGHKTGECHVDGTHGRSPSGPDWHEVTALGDGKRHWINVHTSQQYWER